MICNEKFKNINITIMAGGTGGHVFPALAVANELKNLGANIFWMGATQGIERKIVAGIFPIDYVPIKGIRKKGILSKLTLIFKLSAAVIVAMKYLIKRKTDLVIGFGGYTAAPGGFASFLLRKPLIIHEQNAKSGLTNRALSKIATKILCGFEIDKFPLKKSFSVGIPVRNQIMSIYPENKIYSDRPLKILILGGSLGARILNETVPVALSIINSECKSEILHQTGTVDLNNTIFTYKKHNINANVVEFVDDIKKAYSWTDLIICRAGASTIAEVAVVGIPAIFIPYPFAVDNHQFYNAKYMTDKNAGICIVQKDFTAEKLACILMSWNSDKNKLEYFSINSKKSAKINATIDIINHIEDVLKHKKFIY